MKYLQVKKLPTNCYMVQGYPYPFRFFGSKIYVYEPGFNSFGEAVWYRRSNSISCPLGKKLFESVQSLNF